MWRRMCLYGVLTAIVVSLGWLWWERTRQTPRVNELAYQRIEKGFTESQVQSILRAPPGWYAAPGYGPFARHGLDRSIFTPTGVVGFDGCLQKGWITNDGCIVVSFGDRGKVSRKDFYKVIHPDGYLIPNDETIWERVRRRF